jgi:hypothetical protein
MTDLDLAIGFWATVGVAVLVLAALVLALLACIKAWRQGRRHQTPVIPLTPRRGPDRYAS